jgi:hypothetical protein
MSFAGALLSALVALAAAACAEPPSADAPRSSDAPREAPAPRVPRLSEPRHEVRATIVRVSVRVAESFPPQYFADITSALEDGCAQFSRADLRREGDTLIIDVFNTRPIGERIACTMLYGEKESAVALGSEFEPGESYTLDVNGTRETFVAQ